MKPWRRRWSSRDDDRRGEIELVVAHRERATLRVDDVFLKIDSDQRRADVEVEAMAMAPIPTLAGRARLRPVARGRRVEIAPMRLHEPEDRVQRPQQSEATVVQVSLRSPFKANAA